MHSSHAVSTRAYSYFDRGFGFQKSSSSRYVTVILYLAKRAEDLYSSTDKIDYILVCSKIAWTIAAAVKRLVRPHPLH